MTASYYLIEFATYVFACGCWYSAYRNGRRWLSTVVAATLFGLSAEIYFLYSEHASLQGAHYSYGQFIAMVGWGQYKVPLWVGLGWGCIAYACVWTAGLLTKRISVIATIAGLLAMNIDLSLDPVAQHFGFWTWHNVPQLSYFGVPFDNFLGWVMIIGGYAWALTLLERRVPASWKGQDFWVPMVALVPALVVTVVGQQLLNWTYRIAGNQAIPFVLICGALTAFAIYYGVAADRNGRPQWVIVALPVYFHGVQLSLLLFAGGYRALPALIVVIPVSLFVGFTVTAWPYLDRIFPETARQNNLHTDELPRP